MKTPEEIKRGLEGCGGLDGDCENCPYDEQTIYCNDRLMRDALAYIQQLESTVSQVSKALCGKENATLDEILQAANQVKSRLAQAERERDAAIADLKLYAGCKVCKHGDFKFTSECMDCSYDNNNWQWRGVCPKNTKEE